MTAFNTKHRPHLESIGKFFLLLSVFAAYFGYTWWTFDAATGIGVTLLTWAFFVLCTPIADAGFLLDFPIRVLFKVRMVITELLVWGIAISISGFCVFYTPELFENTVLTSLFYRILTEPFPYWSLIGLSAIGTFLSIQFGDEMLDVMAHRDRDMWHNHGIWLRLIIFIFIFGMTLVAYQHLLSELGVHITD